MPGYAPSGPGIVMSGPQPDEGRPVMIQLIPADADALQVAADLLDAAAVELAIVRPVEQPTDRHWQPAEWDGRTAQLPNGAATLARDTVYAVWLRAHGPIRHGFPVGYVFVHSPA